MFELFDLPWLRYLLAALLLSAAVGALVTAAAAALDYALGYDPYLVEDRAAVTFRAAVAAVLVVLIAPWAVAAL